MQLTLNFDAPAPVELPVHYGPLIQGMLYHRMENPLLRNYLHEQGFQFEKRRFKLFTFSRLTGKELRFNRRERRLVRYSRRLNLLSAHRFLLSCRS